MSKKLILDACCGGRCFWFNKAHPNALYVDNRVREHGHDDHRPNHTVQPDKVMDFRNMDFPDNTFKMVVFDPPHIFGKPDAFRMLKKYGHLDKETWKDDIKKGFDECWRVLDNYGTLLLKWNETSVKVKDILAVIGREPLVGQTINRGLTTHWFVFMKGVDYE